MGTDVINRSDLWRSRMVSDDLVDLILTVSSTQMTQNGALHNDTINIVNT